MSLPNSVAKILAICVGTWTEHESEPSSGN